MVLWDTEEELAVKTFVNTESENWRHLEASLRLPLPPVPLPVIHMASVCKKVRLKGGS